MTAPNHTLRQRLQENRRLCILRTLQEVPGREANESLLHQMVEDFAFSASRAQIRADLSFLSELGLIEVREIASVMIGRLTLAGDDVAAGRSAVPGVKQPDAKD